MIIEFFRHAFGLCGEPHYNLIHLLIGGSGAGVAWLYLKSLLRKDKA